MNVGARNTTEERSTEQTQQIAGWRGRDAYDNDGEEVRKERIEMEGDQPGRDR